MLASRAGGDVRVCACACVSSFSSVGGGLVDVKMSCVVESWAECGGMPQ